MEAGKSIRAERWQKGRNRPERKHGRAALLIGGAVSVFVCLTVVVMAAGKGGQEVKTEKAGRVELEAVERELEETVVEEKPEEDREPFGSKSQDWGADDVEGFTFYELPEDFKQSGGMLPEAVQVYTFCLCRQNNVEFDKVLAVMEVESGYRWDAESSVAYGYMQIVPECHFDRMERLGVYDIKDPYQNIRTGIDYLAEMLNRYDGDYKKALTAYRWGAAGAYRDYFSKGQESCEYADTVMERAGRIKKQLEGMENEAE